MKKECKISKTKNKPTEWFAIEYRLVIESDLKGNKIWHNFDTEQL